MKVLVRSIPKSFRRAKMAFTEKPATFDVDEETCKVLKDVPMRVVETIPETEGPAEGDELSDTTERQLKADVSADQPVIPPRASRKRN
jgi:hypothetical protein